MFEFSDYFVVQSTDPSVWGSDCTVRRAAAARKREAVALGLQFPGVHVSESLGSSVSGPDEDTIIEIERWMERNAVRFA